MVRCVVALLLAATAVPALAADPEAADRSAEPEARSIARDRPVFNRAERIERANRSRENRVEAPPFVTERPRRSEPSQQAGAAEAVAGADRGRRERADRVPAPVARDGASRDSVEGWRWRERNAERIRRAGNLPAPETTPVRDGIASAGTISPPVAAAPNVQREQRSGRALRNRIATEGWRREWREDRRYDWRRHRDRDWNRFNLGIYIDPFGWNYRRWNVGWRLPSRHYRSSYWIHDPWYYRLPPAYGPYRWVRYWDDALLVDLRTGRVVDVIHNFFW